MKLLSAGPIIIETTSLQQTNLPHKSDSSLQNINRANKYFLTVKKRNVSHVKKNKYGNTNSYSLFDISDTTRFFSSKEWRKTRKNTGVLKMIQDCQIRKNNADDLKRRKGGNINGTNNT